MCGCNYSLSGLVVLQMHISRLMTESSHLGVNLLCNKRFYRFAKIACKL